MKDYREQTEQLAEIPEIAKFLAGFKLVETDNGCTFLNQERPSKKDCDEKNYRES